MPQYVIPTLFTAIDRLTPPVMKMQAALSSMAMIGTAKGRVLQNTLNDISAKSMAIGTNALILGGALALPFALGARAAIDFEKQMTNVATLIDTTKENMGAMGDAVLNISKRVPVAVGDLTEALYYVRSAGVDGAHAMGVLETSGKLAVAGLSTATEAAKAVTSAMVSFRQQGLTSDQIANSFFLTVKEGKTTMAALNESFGANAVLVASAGIKLQEFNGATAALTNTGMEASLAQIAVANSVLGLIRPSTEMKKVYKDLNVLTGEQLIAAQGYGGALDAVTASARKLGIEEAKLFNRTAFKGVIALTGQARDMRVTDTKEQFEGVESLTMAYQKQLHTTAAQGELAKNKLMILGIRIGQVLLPALTDLFEAFSAILTPLAEFAKKHQTITKIIVYGIALFATLALTVGALGLVIGVVTKATWLFRGVMIAYNFVVGLAAGLTGNFATALFATNEGMLGLAWGAGIAQKDVFALNLALKGVLYTLELVGLALIIFNRQKIAAAANDNKVGMAYNYFIGDYDAVKESLERRYISDPSGTQQFVADNPKYNSPTIQKSFQTIDEGGVLNDGNDDYLDEKRVKDMQAQNAAAISNEVNVYVDKTGSVKVTNGKGGNIPVKQQQSGQFQKQTYALNDGAD